MSAGDALSDPRRALLQELLGGGAAAHRRPDETVQPRAHGQIPPLSAEQNHVWFHAAMAPDLPLYNEALTIHRNGPFSLDALEKAFNAILQRHEMWRSGIAMREGRLCIVPLCDLRLRLPLIDLTDLPEGEREAAALRLATADALEPFDLARAPLLRARVVRLAPDRHRLYLTLHHIIFDGVSIYRLLVPELSKLYAAYARGEEPGLPPPRLQYGDYALWRERQLTSPGIERELNYWRAQLSGELPLLRLPADRNAPTVPTHRGAMETFHLSPALTALAKEFSRRESVTLYATLLAAFKALLHRYSGQQDIVIGGVTDTRRRPELEGVIGYFLNSFALRTRPRPDASFRDYLKEVQATVVEALDASNLPFDRVVREIAPKRDGSRHPLFQVLFSIEPPAPAFPEGWALTQMDVTVGAAKFDLYLELDQEPDRIIARFLYSTDLFEAPTIRRMIGHWQALLEAALRAPQTTLARLPLLTAPEQQEILVARNATARDYPKATIYGAIEAQAQRSPDAVAVECGGQRWRYRELMARATAIAAQLRQAGARKGTVIAIAAERSLDMLAGLLAILKTGGVYLPLDPGLPKARLQLLVEDARPAIILTTGASRPHLPPSEAAIVVCGDEILLTSDAVLDAEDAVSPDDLAYILYTSGSTGKPKAVEIRHRSVVNLLVSVASDTGFTARDSFLALTTISFDIAGLELYLPLMTGARLVIARSEDAGDPVRLAALIARSGCTAIQATPATWRGLLAAGWRGDRRLTLLCGGEALTADLATSLRDCCGKLWNMYGPTETTIWSLRHEVEATNTIVPIGRPLANTRVYIVDENGAPVPDLVPGELVIAGDGLARGYRNDPALTAAKFVDLPALGERVYRTGDRARNRRDGTIEFLGRLDNQVKIRGFRVGIEEVESALATHPRVNGCAVRAMPDPSGECSLVAYLAGERLGEADIPAIRDFLRELLPNYMVPTNFTILSALPLTANGKVDRKRLPAPQLRASTDAAKPRDEFEAELLRIWKNVLGLPDIGIHDNFFDLGGHSLLACVLVAQIQTALGYELPLAALFRAPTIARLAQSLQSETGPSFSYLVPLRPEGSGRPVFIVHGIFGNVLQLKELAERVTTSRPIYAIQARGADPRQEPHTSIAEMVEAYVDAIRSVQPAGPYALAGYSFGGLIAFEMARCFRRQGEAVDLLALFETDVYARYLPWRDKLDYRLLLLRRVRRKLRRLPPRAMPVYVMSKIFQLGHRILLRLGLRHDFVKLDNLIGPMAPRYRQMYEIGARAFVGFRPETYDGRISVFRIRGPRFGTCDPVPIWRRVARSVDVFEIDGTHGTIMEMPHVGKLAAQFSRCIAAAQLGAAQEARAEAGLSPDRPLLDAAGGAALQGGS